LLYKKKKHQVPEVFLSGDHKAIKDRKTSKWKGRVRPFRC
jgi:tRNA G37 N-methylase TrmD